MTAHDVPRAATAPHRAPDAIDLDVVVLHTPAGPASARVPRRQMITVTGEAVSHRTET